MAYTVDFYLTDRGESPVEEFLASLNIKERAKCRSYIAILVKDIKLALKRKDEIKNG